MCGVRGEILPTSHIPSWGSKDERLRPPPTDEGDGQDEQNDDDNDQHENDDEDRLARYNLLVPNLSLDTGCSPLHPANTAPSEEQMSLTQRLLSLLLTSRLLHSRDLEIYRHHTPGEEDVLGPQQDDMVVDDTAPTTGTSPSDVTRELKAFWTLHIDVLCLSHAGTGSVFDASWLAVLAALRTTKLPRAWWDADRSEVVCSADRGQARGLGVRGWPVSVGFGVVPAPKDATGAREDGRKGTVIVDMDALEEECCAETGCVVVDASEDAGAQTVLVRVEKSGGSAAGVKEVQEIVKIAEGRWREWRALLEEGK